MVDQTAARAVLVPTRVGRATSTDASPLVAATAAATPTTLHTVPAGKPQRLVAATYANKSGSASTLFLGVRLAGQTGANWEPLIADNVSATSWDRWSGDLVLVEGDEIVAYAGTTNVVTVTLEIGQ